MTTPAQATAVQTPANPYPGLRPFDAAENHLFFGRDGQSDEILTSLRRNRFVAVVGTSGSGKSSLIRAGLLPLLHGGFMAKTSSSWRIALFRPGSDPIGNLAQALNCPDVLRTDTGDVETNTLITETTLRRSGLGLIEAVRQARMPARANLLIVVDQFEELFRFRSDTNAEASEDDATFVKLLIEATRQSEAPIYVVITMRSDFIGDCARFRELPETINRGLYLIPLMTRDQRREAIAGPAAVAGTEISPPLINRLLNDLGDNPAQLPILQHALMRTWGDWESHNKNGESIDLHHYEEIGTMTNALSQHADEAFAELRGQRSQEICEKLFKALAEKGPDNREVRRPTKVAEIAAIADASEAEVITVIEAFRQAGRSFLMPPPEVRLNSQSLIDVSHESLISGWRRLKDWVEAEALSAAIYRRVAETAGLYEKGEAGLWHDPDLQVALGWQEKTDPNAAWGRRYHPGFPAAMNFLAESVAARDSGLLLKEKQRVRELRRIRVFAAVLAVLLVMASALGVWAMALTKKARQQEARANHEAQRATEAAISANLQRTRAEEQSGIAKKNADDANTQRTRADNALLVVNEKKVALEDSKKGLVSALAKATRAEKSANDSAESAKNSAESAKDSAESAKDSANFAVHSHFNLVVAFDRLDDKSKTNKDMLTFYDTLLTEGFGVIKKSLDLDSKNREAMVLQVLSQGALPEPHRVQAKLAEEESKELTKSGKPEEAKAKLDEAKAKLEKARSECDKFEAEAWGKRASEDYFQRTLGAFLLAQLAEVRVKLKDTAKATEDVRNAETIADTVGPALDATDEWNWRLLGLTYESLGFVKRNNQANLTDYIRDYQKAAEALAKALQASPSDDNTRNVASSYRRLASLKSQAEDPVGSRDAVDQQIRLIKPLVNRANPTREDQTLLADAYGSRSWHDLFLGDFEAAISDAKTGLSYDDKETWIHTNQAHGYLFSKKTEEAFKIYLENLNKREYPNVVDSKTFAEAILGDFDEFRKRRVPKMDLNAIDDIEKRLADDPVKGLGFRRTRLSYTEKVARSQIELHQKDKTVSYAETINSYRTQVSAYEQAVRTNPSDENARNVASYYRRLATLEWEAEDPAATRDAMDQQIRFLKSLANRANATKEDKTLLADAYGSRSWYDLFLGDFGGAISDAKTGLSYDNQEIWIHTNEAHAYLFLGQIEAARKIYFEYADKRAYPGGFDFRTFREGVLEDFKEFRKRGIPNVNLQVIDKIEDELKPTPSSR